MKLFSLLISSLTFSIAVAEVLVPDASCGFLKRAQCTASLFALVEEITSLPLPPTIDQVKAVLVNGKAFFTECKDCIYGSQQVLICNTIDIYVEKTANYVGIDNIDFDVALCKSEGVIEAVTDTWSDILDVLAPIGIMPVPEGVVPNPLSAEELAQIETAYDTLYEGKPDAPDKKQILALIEKMNLNPEVQGGGVVSIAAVACEVAIVIDSIAIALGAIGLRGGAGKSVATKMYDKLPSKAQKQILEIVLDISLDNFAGKLYEVVEIIVQNLTFNALKDALSELGFLDAITFALSIVAVVATGGVAFVINVALFTYDVTNLIISIVNCFG